MNISKLSNKLTKGTVRSLVITLVIAALLFMVGPTPVQAVTVSITSTTTTYPVGSIIPFTVTVDIEHHQQIPIESIRACVAEATGEPILGWVTFSPSGTETDESPSGAWTVTPVSSTAPYGYCYGYGYGIGWQSEYFDGGDYTYIPPPFACYGYLGYLPWKSFGYVQGYGYGYTGYYDGYYPGTVSLQYTVTLNSTGMAAGEYTAIVDVNTGADPVHYLSVPFYEFSLYSGGPGGGRPPPDTTPPIIDEGSVRICEDDVVTHNSADICWETNESSTSQVGYRASPWVYSPLDSKLVTQHLVHLTDLEPDTTYEYQCLSKDAAGNLSESDIHTFTTLAAPEEEEEAPPEEAPPEEAPPAAPPAAPPEEAPPAPAGVNWALIWGIVAAVVVIIIGVVVWQRRRYS